MRLGLDPEWSGSIKRSNKGFPQIIDWTDNLWMQTNLKRTIFTFPWGLSVLHHPTSVVSNQPCLPHIESLQQSFSGVFIIIRILWEAFVNDLILFNFTASFLNHDMSFGEILSGWCLAIYANDTITKLHNEIQNHFHNRKWHFLNFNKQKSYNILISI